MDLEACLDAARELEGCPLGADEDLMALASPPLYTPFPNPFVEQFLAASPRRPVSAPLHPLREPIAVDVSEGRADPTYMAQNYHTKVPHRAIARYVEHYTEPGDLVFDGFCGSGMVGVAANQVGRRAILCDLSPAATFMAHSYCHPVDLAEATEAFGRLLRDLERECGWLYRAPAVLDYVVWSEVFLCPRCSAEFPFHQVGFDFQRRRPTRRIACPACAASLAPGGLVRSIDESGRTREVPARVAYVGGRRHREVPPGPEFFDLQQEIDRLPIPHWHPDNPMMNRPPSEKGWGDMWRRGYHTGMERVSDFFFKRTLWTLATALHLVEAAGCSQPVRQLMLQVVVNSSISFTRMRRAYQGVLPLVLYVPKLKREVNVIRALAARFRTLVGGFQQLRRSEDVLITTQSTTSLPNIPDGCVDYIFTDPPFGDNIRYSEVNFLWESWLRVFTNPGPEAIISVGQAKGVAEYQELMWRCFAEMHRVLKPGRWITVAFHNSDSRVWNAIQQALQEGGFQVADVRLLDKRQVSFKQASASTVRHDLVISARKLQGATGRGDSETGRRGDTARRGDGENAAPSARHSAPSTDPWSPTPGPCFQDSGPGMQGPALRTQNHALAPDPESAWEFVREYLGRLPLPAAPDEEGPAAAERRGAELFNRMVAAHLCRGLPVPTDAADFHKGLARRFQERDGMYFLPEQAAEYDRIVASSRQKI